MVMFLRSLSFEMGSTVFCFGSSSPASEMSGQRMYYQHLSTTKWQTWNENEGQKIASHTTQIKMQRALLCCHVQITGEQAKIEPYTPKKSPKQRRYPGIPQRSPDLRSLPIALRRRDDCQPAPVNSMRSQKASFSSRWKSGHIWTAVLHTFHKKISCWQMSSLLQTVKALHLRSLAASKQQLCSGRKRDGRAFVRLMRSATSLPYLPYCFASS